MDLPAQLDKRYAAELLADPESHAFSCLVACCALLGDELFPEDGQPPSELELQLMLEGEQCHAHRESITRVIGLLVACSGDEFNEDPTHFHRMCSAIADGDPFAREDDGDPLTPEDIFWAIYQVGLVTDESEPVDELGPRVKAWLAALLDEEAEDVEALAEEVAAEGGDPTELEPYYQRQLVFHRGALAADLVRLGCDPEWMVAVEAELASLMAEFKAG
jgi:hypothetical protein